VWKELEEDAYYFSSFFCCQLVQYKCMVAMKIRRLLIIQHTRIVVK
jgi:hypothetical protein